MSTISPCINVAICKVCGAVNLNVVNTLTKLKHLSLS